jgi:hypothetical protein
MRFSTTRQTGPEVSVESLQKDWESVTVADAYVEIAREVQVRERCYSKWIAAEKITETDARDRMRRSCKACSLLAALVDAPEKWLNELMREAQQSEPKQVANAVDKPF